MSSRPSTPPPSALNAAPPVNLTPEQVKRIEINRLKAKAKLRAKLSDDSASASSSSSTNAHKKRPLQVTPATSNSPTAPAAPPPLKRDSRLMGSYFEYDLSKMVNSKGGFLVEDKDDVDERVKEREKEREMQRTKHDLDAPFFLDPALNPKCRECESIDIDQLFKKVFGCLVCNKCKQEFPEKYSLLTKTECKEDYLLTDPELRDESLLPHILKANPHASTFHNMMLFLRYQVESFAFSPQKWGFPEALDAEFVRREEEKKKKRGKKFEQGLRDLRRKTREGVWQKRRDEDHVHNFVGSGRGEGGGWGKKVCESCGFEIEVEVL